MFNFIVFSPSQEHHLRIYAISKHTFTTESIYFQFRGNFYEHKERTLMVCHRFYLDVICLSTKLSESFPMMISISAS